MSPFFGILCFYVRFSHFLGACIAFTSRTRTLFDNIYVTNNK